MRQTVHQKQATDAEKFELLLGSGLTKAGDHPWIDDAEQVTIGDSGRVFIVRFDTTTLPEFIFNNQRFDILEVWADVVPGGLRRAILGDDTCRRLGWGRTGLSALIRVHPHDADIGGESA